MDYYSSPTAAAIAKPTVNVKHLARSGVSKEKKAQVADDIRAGRTVPVHFTEKQAAQLVGVSASYVGLIRYRRRGGANGGNGGNGGVGRHPHHLGEAAKITD